MNNCPACGAAWAANDRFCRNCGAAGNMPPSCTRCGNPTAVGDRFCGHCGATIQDIVNSSRLNPSQLTSAVPTVVSALRRVSLWYPATGLGCFFYIAGALVSGIFALVITEGAYAQLPTFAAGCLLAYPILTTWRTLLILRGLISRPTTAALPVGEPAKATGSSIWAIILTIIAAGVIWKLRHEAMRPKPNYQRWMQPRPGSESSGSRTRSTDRAP